MKKIITIITLTIILSGCTATSSSLPVQQVDQMPTEDQIISDGQPQRIAAQELAGNQSQYLEFNQASYEQAIADHKVIYLEFYANWCPTCKAQEPALIEAFNELQDPNLIAFRVNYKDTDTDEIEKQLAEKYAVAYQHTKVIIHDNEVQFNKNAIWNKAQALTELKKYEHQQSEH